nr:stress-induced protein YchH [uncultured Moellerella sp.]
MKRKTAFILGNFLMGFGLIMMIASVGLNLFSHVFNLGLSDIITNGSLLGIFIGAMVWLVGAGMSGREKVSDRYWWLRHHHDRYRRNTPKHP